MHDFSGNEIKASRINEAHRALEDARSLSEAVFKIVALVCGPIKADGVANCKDQYQADGSILGSLSANSKVTAHKVMIAHKDLHRLAVALGAEDLGMSRNAAELHSTGGMRAPYGVIGNEQAVLTRQFGSIAGVADHRSIQSIYANSCRKEQL